ncbi:MAG: hypothetical protein LBM76_02650 [Mycoplasmataceae bacterium]|nr:hypothetical protein [Mycoplasmataceae bacterium]
MKLRTVKKIMMVATIAPLIVGVATSTALSSINSLSSIHDQFNNMATVATTERPKANLSADVDVLSFTMEDFFEITNGTITSGAESKNVVECIVLADGTIQITKCAVTFTDDSDATLVMKHEVEVEGVQRTITAIDGEEEGDYADFLTEYTGNIKTLDLTHSNIKRINVMTFPINKISSGEGPSVDAYAIENFILPDCVEYMSGMFLNGTMSSIDSAVQAPIARMKSFTFPKNLDVCSAYYPFNMLWFAGCTTLEEVYMPDIAPNESWVNMISSVNSNFEVYKNGTEVLEGSEPNFLAEVPLSCKIHVPAAHINEWKGLFADSVDPAEKIWDTNEEPYVEKDNPYWATRNSLRVNHIYTYDDDGGNPTKSSLWWIILIACLAPVLIACLFFGFAKKRKEKKNKK